MPSTGRPAPAPARSQSALRSLQSMRSVTMAPEPVTSTPAQSWCPGRGSPSSTCTCRTWRACRPAATRIQWPKPPWRRSAAIGRPVSRMRKGFMVLSDPGPGDVAGHGYTTALCTGYRLPMSAPTFQELILRLNQYCAGQGCVLIQPLDLEVGAGTFHPATFLRALGPEPWNAAYVQPCRRPTDGRYGENPNRLQRYYQYQVVMKPSPDDIVERYFGSLRALGIDPEVHDLRLVEDNWESPTLGAWGLGWEVWLNGMEITQFTYFQPAGGLECRPVTGEITYGLE